MQALQPEILRNELGKFVPLIFIEWAHKAENSVSIILDCSTDYSTSSTIFIYNMAKKL